MEFVLCYVCFGTLKVGFCIECERPICEACKNVLKGTCIFCKKALKTTWTPPQQLIDEYLFDINRIRLPTVSERMKFYWKSRREKHAQDYEKIRKAKGL